MVEMDNKKGLEKTPKPLISLVAKEYFVFTGYLQGVVA